MSVHVRACVHHTSQMTCQGVAEQLVDWHPKVETAVPVFSHSTSTHGHTVRPEEAVGLQHPTKNLGSVITEEFVSPPLLSFSLSSPLLLFFAPIRLPAA